MENVFLDENEKQIVSKVDYEKKCNDIKLQLKADLFDEIDEESMWDIRRDKDGNETSRKKRAVKKNEVSPSITPMAVQMELEELMRYYEPIPFSEAKELPPETYREAYKWYCNLMRYINKYVIMKSTRPNFCGFFGITIETYNLLMQEQAVQENLKWLFDGFTASDFVASSSGLLNSSAVVAEMQTKDAGLGLVKSPEAIVFSGNQFIDKQAVLNNLERFEAMLPQPKAKKKKGE